MTPEVTVALIAAPPACIIALAQWNTARSVGKKNGHGSLQESLKAIHEKMTLDDIDRARGENRQRDLLSAVEELRGALADVQSGVDDNSTRIEVTSSKVDSHMLEDAGHLVRLDGHLERLDSAVIAVHELIGEPSPTHSQKPLIPYVHDVIHALGNTLTVQQGVPAVQLKALERALDTLKLYEQAMQRRELEES